MPGRIRYGSPWARFAAAILFATALASCAPRSSEEAAHGRLVWLFNLDYCEVIEPGLYRCPRFDAPVCTPQFARPEIQCVHLTSEGGLYEDALNQAPH